MWYWYDKPTSTWVEIFDTESIEKEYNDHLRGIRSSEYICQGINNELTCLSFMEQYLIAYGISGRRYYIGCRSDLVDPIRRVDLL